MSQIRDTGEVQAAVFHPKALGALRAFPPGIRRELGKLILDLQEGATLGLPVSRPMPTVASGAHELRVKDKTGAYRTFYFTRSKRGVLIFHTFVKKTLKTPVREIRLARSRLKEMLDEEK